MNTSLDDRHYLPSPLPIREHRDEDKIDNALLLPDYDFQALQLHFHQLPLV
jgi:hypothetical protein